ncbi:MAG: 3-dehydroquinate synthase family protein [Saprospiraceae bacterium]|nr:3-dehydroquinate synthase [Saprospiraceae bacterium]MDW8230842.1 3-dehydroquinate synthase family protein [Saprospiraceae bacterium]
MSAPDFVVAGSPIWLGPLDQTLLPWIETHRTAYSALFLLADAKAVPAGQAALQALAQRESNLHPCRLDLSPSPTYQPGDAEASKTLAVCERVWKAMVDAQLDRRALVLVLGGGVLGDLGGFCAATYKRGIDFVQIPTTLLAMTDAALGGKVGINFHDIKNVLGAFRQPAAVFADPAFLNTLHPRELRSGLAEVVKHAYIGSPELLQELQENHHLLKAPEEASAETWNRLLRRSIAVKARIVSEDPLEGGLRALLNFGHTFGHGLESYFLSIGKPITHGEAIAMGMLCELDDPTPADVALLRLLLPPAPLAQAPWLRVWERMQHDKKNEHRQIIAATPGDAPFALRKTALSPQEAQRRWQRCLRLLGELQ